MTALYYDADADLALLTKRRVAIIGYGIPYFNKVGRANLVNAFIPKPHTPYEDESLADEESLREKLAYLQRELGKVGNVVFRGMPVGEAVWEAFLAKADETSADILREAASGTPVRRLLKTHKGRIDAVVRQKGIVAAAPAPWSFISKR